MARTDWAAEAASDTAVGLWVCDDGTGTPQDTSGNAHHATLDDGSNSWTTDGVMGDVLEIGKGLWSTTADLGTGGAYTLQAVVRLTYTPNDRGNVYVSANGVDSWLSILFSGDLGDGTAAIASSVADLDSNRVLDGSVTEASAGSDWRLITLTVDGTDVELWNNDSLIDTATLDTGIVEALLIMFGGFQNPSAYGGLCAGIAAYGTALSSVRISAHYAALGVGTSDPVMDVEANTVTVSTPAAAFGAKTLPVPTSSYPDPETAPGWVSSFGEVISIDKPLNSYERATIRVPIDHTHPDHLDEVEITRNGHRHFLGRMRNTNDGSADGHMDYQCFGTWHLFTQRYAGSANRNNYLTNGYFEDWASEPWLDNWTAINCTAESVSTPVLTGNHAVKLTNSQTTWPDVEASHYDSAFAKKSHPFGSHFYVAAWCFIDGAFLPGHKTFGLRCRYDTGTMQGDVATFIDITHPVGTWVRHYVDLPLPPDVMAIVVVELYSPVGSIIWDHVQAVGNSAEGLTSRYGSDQTLVAGEFVRAAQHAEHKVSFGVGHDTPPSGIIVRDMMLHYQHEQVAQKVETMATREDGFDFHVDTAGDTKVFRTYFPRRGTTKGALTFPGNVLQYNRTVTGTEAASSIITTGDANDPAREEGGAWDTEALEGLRLEAVIPTPQGTAVSLLHPKAREWLRQKVEPPETVDVTLTEDVGEGYDPGDFLTLTADRGGASFSADYRVVNWRANCTAGTITLSLVRWIEPTEPEAP